MNNEKTRFELASELDVNSKTEKKGNLTYLSWAWAWVEFKKIYPEATYLIKKFGENSLPYVYDEKTGYMVFTEVITKEETLEMWLPVMDFRNKAMKEEATMFDINKTIMRCLTKNLAMFGLGLYIYAGEDLPEVDSTEIKKQVAQPVSQTVAQPAKIPQADKRLLEIKELARNKDFTGTDMKAFSIWILKNTGMFLAEDSYDKIINKLK